MPNNPLGPVVLDVAGLELSVEEKEILTHPKVGGLILFTRNYSEPEQLTGLLRTVREVRDDLVVCVDHEGGRVQRFRDGFTVLPPMQTLGRHYLHDTGQALTWAQELGWLMAVELLAFDIDLSFAPVLDVDDSFSDIIGDRAFSNDPETATHLAQAFIKGMHEAGMASTGKHFPGHGGVKADSHLELPIDTRSMAELVSRDLVPFSKLMGSLDALMSAHIVFPEVDELPVGYSPYWLKEYLRKTLGYQGLVFSDDLSMEGAACAGSYGQRARDSLDAGCDVVLVCNAPQGAIEVIETLEGDRQYDKACGLEKLAKRQTWNLSELNKNPRRDNARKIIDHLINSK